MRAAFGMLLTLLAVEGLLLVFRPRFVRDVLQQTPDGMLRFVGVVEIILVLFMLLLALELHCGAAVPLKSPPPKGEGVSGVSRCDVSTEEGAA